MKIKNKTLATLTFFYYVTYVLQLHFIFLIIGSLILFVLFLLNNQVSLVYLFLVILPQMYGLDLSFYFEDSKKFTSSIYFVLLLDPVIIASILSLIRNFLTFKKLRFKYLFIFYIIILFFHIYQLFFYLK